MSFDEVLDQVRELLRSRGRVTYRALKRRFDLEDEYLEDLKAELIDAEHVARDEDGKVLVWMGISPVSSSTFQVSAHIGKRMKYDISSVLREHASSKQGESSDDGVSHHRVDGRTGLLRFSVGHLASQGVALSGGS